MKFTNLLKKTLTGVVGVGAAASTMSMVNAQSKDAKKPNVIYILADDWGYGDISILNSQSKIKTPNTDNLARQGIYFTDAHSSSAVCTPTRYGVLTGRYNWRSNIKKGVLGGYSKNLIEPSRTTIAEFLKENGYNTAYIGKWHLGWDWQTTDGKNPRQYKAKKGQKDFSFPKDKNGKDLYDNVDYSKKVLNGPTTHGFDYSYGHCGSLDMAPYVYIENDVPTAIPNRITFSKNKYGKGSWWRLGPTGSDFKHTDVLPNFTRRSVKYIQEQAKNDKPFFLYMPIPAPHTPILPTKEFQGKSGVGNYGDFVMQVDDTIGRVMKAVKDAGISENTIIVVTSDNGCSPAADIKGLQKQGHYPSYIYRGHKADIFEGGHRIPFIVKWPAKIKASSVSNDTVCLTDFYATMADVLGKKLADNMAEDSVSVLADLEGKATKPVREAIVHHSIQGKYSIRQGNWKLNFCPGSGGWSYPRPGRNNDVIKTLPKVQLYNLKVDPAERNNLQAQNPAKVKELTKLMIKYIEDGRSTPGKSQKNAKHGKMWNGIKEIYNTLK